MDQRKRNERWWRRLTHKPCPISPPGSLLTNLPAPTASSLTQHLCAEANLEEVIKLYGLRMWVEQSDKQVKHALGWSQYQVRSDKAIRRHWQLVGCAFSFCWYHASPPISRTTEEALERLDPEASLSSSVPAISPGTGKKISEETRRRPQVSWPVALRALRGWLEPWIMLWRYWQAWSKRPPPPLLQCLVEQLGQGLFFSGTF